MPDCSLRSILNQPHRIVHLLVAGGVVPVPGQRHPLGQGVWVAPSAPPGQRSAWAPTGAECRICLARISLRDRIRCILGFKLLRPNPDDKLLTDEDSSI